MSNIINKVKDVLTGNKDDNSTTGTHTSSSNPNYYDDSTNAGPHHPNTANKLDPRVDSDRDGSGALGNTYGSNTGTHGMAGMTSTSETGTFGHTTSGGYGSHSSGMANRADPFVDTTSGTTSHTHTGGMGTDTGYSGSTTSGPHKSNIANKLDPRVDSDRDGSYAVGNTTGSGTNFGSSTYGSSTGTGVTGTDKTTAGPHKSDMANKLDPRVDSDLDGSRNMGSGQNYGSNY